MNSQHKRPDLSGWTTQEIAHTERFRELVNAARLDGVTQEMIGNATDMTPGGVSNYYNYNRKIGFDAALKFSKFFRVPTEQLYQPASEVIRPDEYRRLVEILQRIPADKHERLEQILESFLK